MAKKVVFTLVAVAIFLAHLVFSLPNIDQVMTVTNSILLAILTVLIGILFTIKD